MINSLFVKLVLIYSVLLLPTFAIAQMGANKNQLSSAQLKLGIVLFSNFDQLDVTGPFEIFHAFPNTKIYFISNSLQPVKSVQGIQITPDVTFNSAPQMDILIVPGGPGVVNSLENNPALIHFIKIHE